jgi:hypothetical protein
MSKLVQAIQTKDAVTANGAVTHSTTNSALLDFFSVAGALRQQPEQDVINLFVKARAENKRLALQIVLWARDCRGGAGERRLFRVIYEWAKNNDVQAAQKLADRVPELGRWDDLWSSGNVSEHALAFIVANIENGLLCKWLPREGKRHNFLFNMLCKVLGKTPREFRKYLAEKSKTVEQQMSANQWNQIKYQSVPAKAMSIYNGAFGKHDKSRFDQFVADVKSGKKTIKAAGLYPYDFIRAVRSGKNNDVIDEQWKALPNYGSEENMLVVADVSGSMECGLPNSVEPIDVSISLAMYVAERNKGLFKDCFITFSDDPAINVLKGSFVQRFNQLSRAAWGMSTNIQAVFDLILNKATKNKLAQEDMPTKVIIVSDMEFNQATGRNKKTNFEAIKKQYKKSNYDMPAIVFWNVNGRARNCPVKMDQNGVALVSGASPAILTSVLGGEFNPYQVMIDTIEKERYSVDI